MLFVSASVCAAMLCCREMLPMCICIIFSLLWSVLASVYSGRGLYYIPAAIAAVCVMYCLFTLTGPLFAALIFAAGIYMSRYNRHRFAPQLLFILAIIPAAASLIFGTFAIPVSVPNAVTIAAAITSPACVMRGKSLSQGFFGTLAAIPLAACLTFFYNSDAYCAAVALLVPALISCQSVIFTGETE